MKIKKFYNSIAIISSLKADQVKIIQEVNPEALELVSTNTGDVEFKLSFNDKHAACITKYGILFNKVDENDNMLAQFTLEKDVRDFIKENHAALVKLSILEDHLAQTDALEDFNTLVASVEDVTATAHELPVMPNEYPDTANTTDTENTTDTNENN